MTAAAEIACSRGGFDQSQPRLGRDDHLLPQYRAALVVPERLNNSGVDIVFSKGRDRRAAVQADGARRAAVQRPGVRPVSALNCKILCRSLALV